MITQRRRIRAGFALWVGRRGPPFDRQTAPELDSTAVADEFVGELRRALIRNRRQYWTCKS